VAKQLNLIRWAEQAVPHLAAAGIETQVVGTVPPNLRARIARPGLSFTGPVPDVAPYLANARFGLVAEDVGGGFKLKTLDYIFHRLPVAALDGNLAGQPQGVLDNALSAPTPRALADAIGSSIDDLERLNQMQHNAFRAAEPAFDWAERARRFLHALDTLNPKD
jgi:glycosyltransferase involved in cell wall biosynthesis